MIERSDAGAVATATSPPDPRRATPGGRMAVVVLPATAIAATAAIAVALVLARSDATRLVVYDVELGRTVYERSIEIDERFELTHTHSVTGRQVNEVFSVLDRTTVAIEELWFDQHGANLPTGSERIGETTTTYIEEPHGYRVLHHGHPIGSLPLLVGGPEVDHVLRFSDGERLRLLDVSRAGARIEVSLGGER